MKIKLLMTLLCCLVLSSATFAQTNKATKFDEFGYITCGHLTAIGDALFQKLQDDLNSKIYIIYYEGEAYQTTFYNKKTKQYDIPGFHNPIKGQALIRAKEVPLYLTKHRKFPQERIVLVDGGFMENQTTEIWILLPGAEIPKPSPTVEAKDVKFRDRKLYKPRDCGSYYDNL